MGMPRVHYLRSEADARALQADLQRTRELLVVGGGLIGLEVAAAAATLGVKVTVLEVAPRILARVCDEHTAAERRTSDRRDGHQCAAGSRGGAAADRTSPAGGCRGAGGPGQALAPMLKRG